MWSIDYKNKKIYQNIALQCLFDFLNYFAGGEQEAPPTHFPI